jgi:Ca2+-binding RTX toxin-like protein
MHGENNMASITVMGAHAQTVTLAFSASANLALAKQLAGAMTAGIGAHTLLPFSSLDGPPPLLPTGKEGEYVVQSAGATLLPAGYTAVVVAYPNSFVQGSGDNGESVLSGSGGLTFLAPAGSGTVVAGGGNNDILITPGSTGAWAIATGDGNDTIYATGNGNDTIQPGGGHNKLLLGAGNDLIQLTGYDSISAGAGSTTIDASNARSTYVQGGTGSLLFIGGDGPATVFGGLGSVTVVGDRHDGGPLEAHGGTAGHNLLMAGSGAATLFGGGDGDILIAGGAHQALHAGLGNETLTAALGSHGDTLYGGAGRDLLIGSSGEDIFVAGSGAATMTGGGNDDLFAFIEGAAGGHDLIVGFGAGDLIGLQGYGAREVKNALRTQTVGPDGVTITLSDHTTIAFAGLSSLRARDFVVLGNGIEGGDDDSVFHHRFGDS